MEVIRETKTNQPVTVQFQSQTPVVENTAIAELQARFKALEDSRNTPFEEIKKVVSRPNPQPVDNDEMITRRNAAMIVLTYLGQKKQAILLAILGAAGVFLITSFTGIIGGVLGLAAACIWFGSQYLSNEKETKALKERFVI